MCISYVLFSFSFPFLLLFLFHAGDWMHSVSRVHHSSTNKPCPNPISSNFNKICALTFSKMYKIYSDYPTLSCLSRNSINPLSSLEVLFHLFLCFWFLLRPSELNRYHLWDSDWKLSIGTWWVHQWVLKYWQWLLSSQNIPVAFSIQNLI